MGDGDTIQIKQEPMEDNSECEYSVAGQSLLNGAPAIKVEPDSNLTVNAEHSAEFAFQEAVDMGADEHIGEEQVTEDGTLFKEDPESDATVKTETCCRFLTNITGVDYVQVKKEWVEDETLGGRGACDAIHHVKSNLISKCVPGPSEKSVHGLNKRLSVESATKERKAIKRKRDLANTYSCYACSKTFKWKCQLRVHLRQHAEDRPYYACGLCESRFTQACNLKRHMMIHTGEKPFACDMCESRFSTAFALKTHKRGHTGEKPFACDMCESRFNRAASLKDHKRIHTGERPFACHVCGSRFSQAGHLEMHKKTHSGDKPFECDVCKSRFNRAGNLKMHKQIHTGEKPFGCDICELRFNRASNLKAHKRIHTG